MKEHLKEIERLHNNFLTIILEAKEQLQELPIEELCDAAYFIKKCGEVFKSLQIESDKFSGFAQRLACLRWMVDNDLPAKVDRPDYTATPDLKMQANIPSHSREPEAYHALLSWIGVPEHAIKTELLRVHWPTLVEFLTERQADGKSLPPGVSPDKTKPQYLLRFRSKGGS